MFLPSRHTARPLIWVATEAPRSQLWTRMGCWSVVRVQSTHGQVMDSSVLGGGFEAGYLHKEVASGAAARKAHVA